MASPASGKRIVTFKLDRETLEILEEIAAKRRTSRSALIRAAIRMAIEKWLSENNKNNPKLQIRRPIEIMIGDKGEEDGADK